jgi:hypothetical protein
MTSRNSSTYALPGTEKQSESGLTTPDLVAAHEEQDIDAQSGEKQETGNRPVSPVVEEEYPTGKRMIPIILSLVCTVFLVALDMVSYQGFSMTNITYI